MKAYRWQKSSRSAEYYGREISGRSQADLLLYNHLNATLIYYNRLCSANLLVFYYQFMIIFDLKILFDFFVEILSIFDNDI